MRSGETLGKQVGRGEIIIFLVKNLHFCPPHPGIAHSEVKTGSKIIFRSQNDVAVFGPRCGLFYFALGGSNCSGIFIFNYMLIKYLIKLVRRPNVR